MPSTDPPPPVSTGSALPRPLSTLGAAGIAGVTAVAVFASGVYLVERGVPGATAPATDASSAATTASTSVAGASSAAATAPATVTGASSAAATAPATVTGASSAAATASAAAAGASPAAATASATAASASPAAATASATAAALPPRAPRPGYGWLTLISAQNATVYVTGVAVGPSNQPLEVRCGRFFVRIGEPTRNGTRWLAEGRTVVIKCGALTEAAF